MTRRIVSETALILLVAVTAALVVNSFRPSGIRIFETPASSAVSDGASSGEPGSEISLSEAMDRYSAGDTLFADARPPADFRAGHIDGARNLPVADFESWIGDFMAEVAPETPIITYCDGVNCELGIELARELTWAGYTNVRHLANGWTRWREAGMPTEFEG
jgi:rhodanese-related sulfurtransferase